MFKNLSSEPIAEHQNKQADRWDEINLLEKCVEGREGSPRFIFYEGPPTANGRPGIHHVISRTLKDSINRHKTMQGYQVPRKAGWDTHGLPVEIEVEKQLELFTKKDIETYGIGAFNEKCRESVFKYEGLWREMSRRMGFLVDLDHPYITLDNDYIETEWWILKKFFDEGFIYEGHKILPYCPRCGTGLASHEVSLGYKEVKTNTVTVLFKRKDADEYFLAWTTTPWTLASNVALTVGPDVNYIKARLREGGEKPHPHAGKTVYVAEKLADKVLGADTYDVIETVKGSALEYIEYEQLMPFVDVYAYGKPGAKAFFVTTAGYATDEDGTGIVHTAPAFGEDDYSTGSRYGLPVANPVDEAGQYTATPWAGRFVMEDGLDVDIIKWLAGEGKLFSREKMEHNYPFCWRCDTPLIYYSKPSWYIAMTKLKDELIANNSAVNWFPDFVGEKRFGNWLENVNDWAISRTRYWGTPIPIWRCPDCGKLTCVGSRDELREKAIEDVSEIELHRPYVDGLHIACESCGAVMERIPEVMDCWFDSGSMPYAQQHYPFEHKEDFYQRLFPADFICEGIDQTRGWFYSLMAIAAFIEKDRVRGEDERPAAGGSPYRNCLVNDLILDKFGKKMSKTRGNTADPFEMFDKYGADATRWYLLQTSPAWSPTKFDEEGLAEVQGKFFGTLRNIYHFFVLYANQDGVDPRSYSVDYSESPELDRWILSKYQSLIRGVISDMDTYDHMKATRRIQDFVIEEFSNWYIRRARRRFWAEDMTEDKKSVYAVTYEILTGLTRLAAPFAPFISDEIYTNLTGDESVHLALYPEADSAMDDEDLEKKMDLVRAIVALGRGTREKERIKVRQPLASVIVNGEYEPLIGDMDALIREELNIKEVVFAADTAEYFNISIVPDFRVAGKTLGSKMKAFAASLARSGGVGLAASLDAAESAIWSLASDSVIEGATEPASDEEILVGRDYVTSKIDAKEGYAVAAEGGVFAVLDTTLTEELTAEGIAREFVSKIQQLRKQHDLEMMDNIRIAYSGDSDVKDIVSRYGDYIKKETLALSIVEEVAEAAQSYDLNGHGTTLSIEKVD